MEKSIYKKAVELNLPIEQLCSESVIEKVREIEALKFENENYPDGTAIKISCCSECSTYFKSENRCSCGNRRIGYSIEGDIVNGFSIEIEAN